MVTAVVARGAGAGQTGARIKTALGKPQMFDAFGRQLTFAQGSLAGFSGARRQAVGVYTGFGPDAVYPVARIAPPTLDLAAGMGFVLEAGHVGFAIAVPIDGQSLAVGATAGVSGLPASAQYNTMPPLPGKFLCFNGGPYPNDANPGGEETLATAIDPSRIASFVDCADFLNTKVLRDTPLYSAGLMVANALVGTPHKLIVWSFAVGQTSATERWLGFTGSRAEGLVSITGTAASITVTSGGGDAVSVGLILTGPGIAADTIITAITGGDPAGACTATVSVSQTVVGASFATQDQKPVQYQNFMAAIDAFKTLARAQNLTPIMPWVILKMGEAEGNAVAVANARNTELAIRAVVNAFAARLYAGGPNTAQIPWIIDSVTAAPTDDINHFPVTNEDPGNQNTPDTSLMGKLNKMALASLQMARGVDAAGGRYDTRWVSCAAYHYPTTSGARVHIGDDPIGYIYCGGDLGMTAIRIGNGLEARWPAILRVSRTKGSRTVTVTYSEPCEFDGGELMPDPGQHGFRYADALGSINCSGFSWAGSVLTFTLASDPVGAETLSYACGNATLFDPVTLLPTTDLMTAIRSTKPPYGPLSGGLASGGYPWAAPGYGLGPDGQRGQVRAVEVWGTCPQTGRPLTRYANHQEIAVDVDAGTGTLLAMHTAAGFTAGNGLAPAFIADIGDAACYPGTGQTITDRSPSAALLWLGLDGTTANDPLWQAAASGLPAWLKFDGGGGAGVKSGQFCKAQGTPAFLDTLHKAGGAAILIGAVYMPTLTPPNTQNLLANCRNGSGGGAGIAFRISTAGQPGITVRGATGGSVFNYNLPNPASKVTLGWNVFAIGIKDGGSLWSVDSNGSKFVTTVNTAACAYGSPSTGLPESVPYIGGNYVAAVANTDSMVNGAGIGAVGVAPWTDSTTFLPVFRSLCDRFLLPLGPLPVL